jgi:hypothetical protein
VARNGRPGEEVDEEELVVLVRVRCHAVNDIVVAVNAVVLECAAVGRGEQ